MSLQNVKGMSSGPQAMWRLYAAGNVLIFESRANVVIWGIGMDRDGGLGQLHSKGSQSKGPCRAQEDRSYHDGLDFLIKMERVPHSHDDGAVRALSQ